MNNTFTCPHCNKPFEMSEALKHDLIEIKDREIARIKKETEVDLEKKFSTKFAQDVANLEKENDEEKVRNKKLTEQVGELLEEMRKLRRKDEEREVEMKKKLMDEEEKIRAESAKAAEEKSSLQILELQKKLSDTEQALITAQSKTKQGSQQLQGEVMELELEGKLKSAFIHDEISPVGKGVVGADIIQTVKNTHGNSAGIILWETKRAKWTPSWLPKLRDDARKVGANVTVLVTEELPKDVDNFNIVDGILITSYSYAIPLAGILRRQMIQLAIAKSTAANKDEKLESLYGYLQSETFRHRFEAYVEGIVQMQKDLETEKRSSMSIWKKREVQINRTLNNLSNMYGELQGIMGSALPDIKLLTSSGEAEENSEEEVKTEKLF
ncbi:MAG: DUF2130 domain-containing protein [Patescibacteria group bacterium]